MGSEDHANTPSVNLKNSSKRSPLESLNREKNHSEDLKGKKCYNKFLFPMNCNVWIAIFEWWLERLGTKCLIGTIFDTFLMYKWLNERQYKINILLVFALIYSK